MESLVYLIIFVSSINHFVASQICTTTPSLCGGLVTEVFEKYPNYDNLTTSELIARLGYPVETHEDVETEDGYKLTLFRIPFTNKSPKREGKIPVLLMHGVLASSAQWMWQPSERALIFMLADAGFDVWLGNARGTSYSLDHVWLRHDDPDDQRYWDFSFHEMGIYDIPAQINYITNLTGQDSIYYIGHSLGTTQLFVALTERPEFNAKIRTMFSLATAGYIANMTNPALRALALQTLDYEMEQVQERVRGGKFSPDSMEQIIGPLTDLCPIAAVNCLLCNTAFGGIFGMDICQTNFTMLPGVLAHLPDTTSLRTMSHLSQHDFFPRFGQYDYGIVKNLELYGRARPPSYNWSNFNSPVVIFSGPNDNIATPLDASKTGFALGSNLKLFKSVGNSDWTHMDHVLGIDADIYVYNDIIRIMKNQIYG